MKGYLSRIARQTGLRISDQNAGLRKAAGLRPTVSPERLSPIEREETVMVPPGIEARQDAPKKETLLKGPRPNKHRNKEDTTALKPETNVADMTAADTKTTTDDPVTRQPVVQTVSKPPHGEIDAGIPLEEQPSKAGSVPNSLARVSEDRGTGTRSIEAVGQPVRLKPPVGEDKNQLLPTVAAEDSPAEPKGTKKNSERNYFGRTAEIIGGRQAHPEEVQTILLQEIQEWVTAGEQAEDLDISLESSREEIETREAVQMSEPEPGVVRIGQKQISESNEQESKNLSPSIEEQSFDLSIGTISVVIEGDEKPFETAPKAQPGSNQGAPETSDRFSRLKRSFL